MAAKKYPLRGTYDKTNPKYLQGKTFMVLSKPMTATQRKKYNLAVSKKRG
jgi:hypothetical protein